MCNSGMFLRLIFSCLKMIFLPCMVESISKRFFPPNVVIQLCPTLCDPMDCNMPGFPVLHYLPMFAKTQVHWVSDIIQISHPSPPALNLSQHQSLFQGVSSLHQVAKELEIQLSAPVLPMNIQGWLSLGLTGLISLLSKGLPRVFSSTTIKRH